MPRPKPEHGGQILHQDGQVKARGQKAGNGHGGGDGELANRQWNEGCDSAAECQQQEREGGGNRQTFAVMDLVGAGLANVEIQRNLARQFEFYGGITTPQLIFKRVCLLMKLGNERFHRPVRRLKPDENKRSTAVAQENRIVQVKVGNDSRNARFVFQSRLNGG